MPHRSLAPGLTLWASAYVGWALFLPAGLLPQTSVSIALLGQLFWLALVGSVPTTLMLGAASRMTHAPRGAIGASAAAVLMFGVALGWEHTDFLLSGPQWMFHPQRHVARIVMVSAFGLVGAGGWVWLILGTRIERRQRLAAWIASSLCAVGLLMAAIVRYRAYDYSMAQLVFPAGVLSGAIVYLLVRESRHWPIVLGAAALCVLMGAGSRFEPALVATGQREVVAHSRAAALTTLYVLPHFTREETWSIAGKACPEPRAVVEQSPIGLEPNERRNVIIVTVDALRNDIVGMEIGGRPVTPELTRLAKSGVSFTHATSTYPATLFAVGSAFTGLSPAELYLSPALPDTIFTRARAHVDQQLAVLPDVSWFRLPIVQQFLAPGAETAFAPTDAAATDALITRLQAARADGASVMAWVHYYAPHDPYQAHSDFPFGRGKKNAYLSEVAYFDRELGRLMQYLNEDGWLADTLVVFFSDHGEALGEKSYWGHHVYLNGWMVDVPLVLWHAKLPASKPRVGVSLADVAPTVLHFLGLPAPSDIPAQSLFTLDPNLPNRPSFSEAFPVRGRELFDSFRLAALDDASIRARLRSIRVASKGYEPKGAITLGRYRLIHHRGADTTLFYDHQSNPGEEIDEAASIPEAGKLLRRELDRWEQEQLRRVECRLQLTEDRPAISRPE
ncbi:MAG: sulfatase-like hydrolase/transferase [Deltaproteobacteria bacterium]|nr:sulfatase-like hydrolase/transferase [Deltaproteobacteria bacterium]MBW2549455.1 sulfatase-like hydrolase/transferase [Deltaproteobacteria bacterium]MBW2626049.1 sulfatase-like hydrolase/transferase [Deltaproteobacteria bacterium]